MCPINSAREGPQTAAAAAAAAAAPAGGGGATQDARRTHMIHLRLHSAPHSLGIHLLKGGTMNALVCKCCILCVCVCVFLYACVRFGYCSHHIADCVPGSAVDKIVLDSCAAVCWMNGNRCYPNLILEWPDRGDTPRWNIAAELLFFFLFFQLFVLYFFFFFLAAIYDIFTWLF